MNKTRLIAEAYRRLDSTFPQARCELEFKNVFQLVVAVQLSAQCTDERVNRVTPALFDRVGDWRELAEIPQEDLERSIFSTGFYRNKARNLRAAAKMVLGRYNGSLPETMTGLLTIPGIARKTANVILETGFNKTEGITIDTHVKRIAHRLRLTRDDSPVKIERTLMEYCPKKYWKKLPHLFIWLGRRICFARKPACEKCPLADICPSSRAAAVSAKVLG